MDEKSQKPENKTEDVNLRQLLDCLEFAHGAIGDAIATEDGLDGAAGEKVIEMIEEQLAKHKVNFDKFKVPAGTTSI